MSRQVDPHNFFQLSFLNAKEILTRSNGQIISSNTIDLRKGPIEGGLFCEKIFGSSELNECYCGKIKQKFSKNIICTACQTRPDKYNRRRRIGHIEFNDIVIHPWFFFQNPNYYKFFFQPFNDLHTQIENSQSSEKIKLGYKKKMVKKKIFKIASFLIWPEKKDQLLKKSFVSDKYYSQPYLPYDLIWMRHSIQKWKDEWSKYPIDINFIEKNKRLTINSNLNWIEKNLIFEKQDLFLKRLSQWNNNKQIILYSDYHIRSLKMKESFIKWRKTPEGALMKVFPIIPPDLRPIIKISERVYMSSDINHFYRIIIEKNKQIPFQFISPFKKTKFNKELDLLNHLYDTSLLNYKSFPKSKSKELQYWIFHLFHNEKSNSPIMKIGLSSSTPYISLQQRLRGKSGRFRFNLLGKRTDYSGRSVIIPNPNLFVHEIEFPKFLTLELFKPFLTQKIRQHLKLKNKLSPLSFRKNNGITVEKKNLTNSTWINDNLKIFSETHLYHWLEKLPILVNRAPTLHRMNIQSFSMKISNSSLTIGLHPLICASFNADFDGDQMAVYLPFSSEAQSEAINLLSPFENFFSPAHGKTLMTPSLDIVLGIYFLTISSNSFIKNHFLTTDEIWPQVEANLLALQDNIEVEVKTIHFNKDMSLMGTSANIISKKVKTTAGRVLFYEFLKKTILGHDYQTTNISGRYYFKRKFKSSFDLSFEAWNKVIKKKDLIFLLNELDLKKNKEAFLIFLQNILNLGIKYSYWSGLSFSAQDSKSNSYKDQIFIYIDKLSNKHALFYQKYYLMNYESFIYEKSLSPISFMEKQTSLSDALLHLGVYSGSRGSYLQLRQITSLRGFISRPNGETTAYSIPNNLKDGLTIMNYFLSSHGARKGIIDTSIKTAAAGYLTRKLANSVQHYHINVDDCHTTSGIFYNTALQGNNEFSLLNTKLFGRVLAAPVYNLEEKKNLPLLQKGAVIQEREMEILKKNKIESVLIRSPMTCQSSDGLCQKCYGFDLTLRTFPSLGTAVGIIAGESIGEPGTQLTMRTFHTGGASLGQGSSSSNTSIAAPKKSIVIFEGMCDTSVFVDKKDKSKNFKKSIIMKKDSFVFFLDPFDYQLIGKYEIPYGSYLFIEDGSIVEKNTKVVSWNLEKIPIINFESGYLQNEEDNLINLNHFFHLEKKSLELYSKLNNFQDTKKIINSFFKTLHDLKIDKSFLNLKDTYNEFKIWFVSENFSKYSKFTKEKNSAYILNRIIQFITQSQTFDLLPQIEFICQTMHNTVKSNNSLKKQSMSRMRHQINKNLLTISYIQHTEDTIIIEKKKKIYFGEVIGHRIRSFSSSKDITGDIAEVTKLFDARGKSQLDIAPLSGHISFITPFSMKSNSVKINSIFISPIQAFSPYQFIQLPGLSNLQVRFSDFIRRGDILTYNLPSLNELAYFKGPMKFYEYLYSKIHQIYLDQGISINDKHLELLLKAMMDITLFKTEQSKETNIIKKIHLLSYLSLSLFETRHLKKNNYLKIFRKTIHGVNEISSQQDSWLASAAFERLQNVLIHSSFLSKVDRFKGPFESTMPGKTINIGTGFLWNINSTMEKNIKNNHKSNLKNRMKCQTIFFQNTNI